MGVCTSCLRTRQNESYDEDDVSRLLLDDPNNIQYGSFGEHHMNAQADPLESQREVEALQRVVARTSNNLVDVFEIAPPEPQRPHPAMFSAQDLRLTRYQNILSKLSCDDGAAPGDGGNGAAEWLLSEDDNVEPHGKSPHVKELDSSEALVGTFADAAAAVA
ncbi:late endosomal/lysosomal adaptor and MAPK and MTOR activator-domain-containing protein [Xylariomycetidae sp. FL0641]|nr:late endosomal/lysosomal adaptor and MAPK and MTOR activator-domain-containing protein [Xylariomycetidae sp. FL0641]